MKDFPKPTHAILFRKPCGCIVGSCVYGYEMRVEIARIVAEEIREGNLPESISWTEYRQRSQDGPLCVICPHGVVVKSGIQQGMLREQS